MLLMLETNRQMPNNTTGTINVIDRRGNRVFYCLKDGFVSYQ